MERARNSSMGVSPPQQLILLSRSHNSNDNSAAEITSGFLIVCFPEMSFLISRKSRKRNYPRRPTAEFGGSSSGTGMNSRNRSRKMGSNRDDLTYYELDDDIVYGVRVSPSGSNSRLHEPAHGTVQVHHEITIESNKKEEIVTVNGQR